LDAISFDDEEGDDMDYPMEEGEEGKGKGKGGKGGDMEEGDGEGKPSKGGKGGEDEGEMEPPMEEERQDYDESDDMMPSEDEKPEGGDEKPSKEDGDGKKKKNVNATQATLLEETVLSAADLMENDTSLPALLHLHANACRCEKKK